MLKILYHLNEGNVCELTMNGMLIKKVLTLGLPQGSVLSPILFNAFINDIVGYVGIENSEKILLYADDIVIYDTKIENLQEICNRVQHHAETNDYQLNPSKCMAMIPRSEEISLYNQELAKVEKFKYMGYHFNCKGSDVQANFSTMQQKMMLNTFRFKGIASKIVYLWEISQYYKTYIRTHADYFSRILCASKEFIAKTETLQRKILKNIHGLKHKTPTNLLYALTKVETMEYRNTLLTLGCRRKAERLHQELYFRKVYAKFNTRNLEYIRNTCINVPDEVKIDHLKQAHIKENIYNALRMDIKTIKPKIEMSDWLEMLPIINAIETDGDGKRTNEILTKIKELIRNK